MGYLPTLGSFSVMVLLFGTLAAFSAALGVLLAMWLAP